MITQGAQLEGERVRLRPMEMEDVPHKVRWLQDSEVVRTLIIDPVSELGTRAWLQKVVSDPARVDFIIDARETMTPIGFASLVNINYRHRKAETYLAIGDRTYWRRGLGAEAKLVLLHYAFGHIGLNRVYAHNLAENQAVIRLNQKLGFTLEGTLRSDLYHHGAYADKVIMSILREEFERLHGIRDGAHNPPVTRSHK